MDQSKVAELQRLEQSLSSFASQKQVLLSQQLEVDNALTELSSTTGATYRIVGSVMVACDRASLTKDLSAQKESLTLRLATVEKQEVSLRKKAESLHQELTATTEGVTHG
jgi:prefoldin beta subunit